jgi:hypothetical protein
MWLFSQHGMISAVKHKYIPGHLMVRARYEKDIRDLAEKLETHGYKATCKETKDADYRWRLTCSKKAFTAVMVDMVDDIDYTNFKNRIHEEKDTDRDHAYMEVWSAMYGFQRDKYNPRPKIGFKSGGGMGFGIDELTEGRSGYWYQDGPGNYVWVDLDDTDNIYDLDDEENDELGDAADFYLDLPDGTTVAGAPAEWGINPGSTPAIGSKAWETLFEDNEPIEDNWSDVIFPTQEEVEQRKRGNTRGAKSLHELPPDEFDFEIT